MRVLARLWMSTAIMLGLAKEARSSGDSVALVVQVPKGGVVGGRRQNQVRLRNDHRDALLTVDVEAADEAKSVMEGARDVLDQLATNVFDAALATAKGSSLTGAPIASGRETIADRAAYFYRGALTNGYGLRFDVELWIIAIDDTRVGFIALTGNAVGADRLRQAARAARLTSVASA